MNNEKIKLLMEILETTDINILKTKSPINIDTDEANNGALTIFFNREIVDDDGNFLGVGGVGISVTKLQSLLRRYEKEYNLDINLINSNKAYYVFDTEINIKKQYHF